MAILVGWRARGYAGRRFLCRSRSRPPREREFLSAQSLTRASVRAAFPRSGWTGRTALPEKGDLHFQFSGCFRWTSLAHGSSNRFLSRNQEWIALTGSVGSTTPASFRRFHFTPFFTRRRLNCDG